MIASRSFAKKIIEWSVKNQRNYPWINERDPYKIWISEIILQQTRSDQAKPYYELFIKRFPTLQSLSTSTEDDVLLQWKGLGYYSRARNLYKAALYIKENLDGNFPQSYSEILKLNGIGSYTAAAISSFAFNEVHAVVDGNVVRLLSRIFGIDYFFGNSSGKKYFETFAQSLIDIKQPAAFNQAIMNFGAVVCLPKNPNCKSCIFLKNCIAFTNDSISKYPVKSNKTKLRIRYFHYFIFKNKSGEFPIKKRTQKDIWSHLYEFPLVETKQNHIFKKLGLSLGKKLGIEINTNSKIDQLGYKRQKLTHQDLHINYYLLENVAFESKIKPLFSFVKPENLVNFAFPKATELLLKFINP